MVFVNYGNVIEAAHREGKWVGVYSEIAGEPSATPLLHGLQLDGFSASPKLNKSSEDEALQRREVRAYLQSILKKVEPGP